MTYWRMQLHPAEPLEAVRYSVESLVAGYIGLDFEKDVGDLEVIKPEQLPEGQSDFWAFAREMKEGDPVLVIAHHLPLALATVAGPYNYIKSPAPELGVWFRHFRKVKDVKYYADFTTDAHAWKRLTMTDTISPLRDKESLSYKLIREWLVC